MLYHNLYDTLSPSETVTAQINSPSLSDFRDHRLQQSFSWCTLSKDSGKPLNPLAALYDGVLGFDATQITQLEELLHWHDLPVPDHVDMPGISKLEAVEVR